MSVRLYWTTDPDGMLLLRDPKGHPRAVVKRREDGWGFVAICLEAGLPAVPTSNDRRQSLWRASSSRGTHSRNKIARSQTRRSSGPFCGWRWGLDSDLATYPCGGIAHFRSLYTPGVANCKRFRNVPHRAMLRGHVWDSPTFPASSQEAILLESGVPKRAIYRDDMPAALKSLRKGDRLVVVGCRGVGRSMLSIAANIERVHERGAVVMDATTGRLSSKHYALLIKEAVKALANERRGPRRRGKKDRRMPWDLVARYYFDPLLTNDQVEAAVADGYTAMSYTTMWRHFKRGRGAIQGRPSNAGRAAQLEARD